MIVVGGCGDYFDVHDTAILVDNYTVSDATERAHSVSDPTRTPSFMPSCFVGWTSDDGTCRMINDQFAFFVPAIDAPDFWSSLPSS